MRFLVMLRFDSTWTILFLWMLWQWMEVNGRGYSSCPRRCCQLLLDTESELAFSRWSLKHWTCSPLRSHYPPALMSLVYADGLLCASTDWFPFFAEANYSPNFKTIHHKFFSCTTSNHKSMQQLVKLIWSCISRL